jgi:hypothetical protein
VAAAVGRMVGVAAAVEEAAVGVDAGVDFINPFRPKFTD